jgi:hypothetical protein
MSECHFMRRALAIAGSLLLLAACGASAWLVLNPPVARFVVAGAQDLQVKTLRRNEWQINYRVAEVEPAWYDQLGRQLEQQGWQAINLGRYDGLKANYMRVTRLPVGQLREWAYMAINHSGDQRLAQVIFRRRIELPWRLRN